MKMTKDNKANNTNIIIHINYTKKEESFLNNNKNNAKNKSLKKI